jgi:hypothetical protein
MPRSIDEARVLLRIHDGAAINTLRQDVVYELFRRGLLVVDADNRLHISESGKAACKRLQNRESGQ